MDDLIKYLKDKIAYNNNFITLEYNKDSGVDYEAVSQCYNANSNFQRWVKQLEALESARVQVTSAGEIIEDGILRTAVLHD